MATKTTYSCDLCNHTSPNPFKQFSHKNAKNVDVCNGCIWTIVTRVINKVSFKLRIHCTACKGTGYIRNCTGMDGGGRNEYETVMCQECML